jgi:flavin-dependent dehydrogenase
MYDVIVVGARVAGASAATLLARQGYRVLLVDRATFPSDTISTHYIHNSGIARLSRWGLLDRIEATGCPPILRARFDVGPFAISGTPAGAGEPAYAPRRRYLDAILVEAAVEAGVEVRQKFSVHALLFDGDRVIGIQGRDAEGRAVTEQAAIVVGADGAHSFVARSVRAAEYHVRPSLTCTYYTYWSGVDVTAAELYAREGRLFFAFPTNDVLTCVGVIWRHDEFAAVRRDVESSYLASLELGPGLAERVRAGRREERFYGTADLRNFFRKPHGAGWALVGDAGYHKDPITGQGITDGLRDAELLADALDVGLSGRRTLGEALSSYERLRNALAKPMYDYTCLLAMLERPSEADRQLFMALSENQVEANRFFGALAGTVPVSEFFSASNVERIVSSSAVAV